MQLGYNTSGFAFHRLDDALDIIAETGYSCVALTLDVHHFDPFRATPADVRDLRAKLRALKLSCVIETGARFLLDAKNKHRPTLLDADSARRVEFLHRAIDICAELEGECVSYWSGARPENSPPDRELYRRLSGHVDALETYARQRGVRLAFEPEPGFLIETMRDFDSLCDLVGHPIGLTLDIGHLQCVESEPPHAFIAKYASTLINVQLDDMKYHEHKHLMFGEGEVDFPPVFAALNAIAYAGPACVELSDASRAAVESARRAYEFLAGHRIRS
ncbi:MAG: sugar phosphate isomerase/epimerase [Planctomycetes bacterium]|nr:sugar phosphate isomerase/epimerase [Planctomycetota bacterium]NUQ33505.1 sugar phosphate isomerase/epimerase [Planctomycetaceae bacterium]